MNDSKDLQVKLVLSLDEGATLRDLDSRRSELASYLIGELSAQADVIQSPPSRSLDPAVVGAIGLAILPIAVEKFADLMIKWAEIHKDCSVTINIRTKSKESVSISYNPKTTSPETLQKWIKIAADSLKAKE
jgi:hypothetical protein